MRRILVTGSRTWTRARTVREALAEVWADGTAVLVSGACPAGADAIAEMFWRRWGGRIEQHRVTSSARAAHGRRAFLLRDDAMVQAGAEVCLAFIDVCLIPTCNRPGIHGSHGTSYTAAASPSAVSSPPPSPPCSDSDSSAEFGGGRRDETPEGQMTIGNDPTTTPCTTPTSPRFVA